MGALVASVCVLNVDDEVLWAAQREAMPLPPMPPAVPILVAQDEKNLPF